MFESSEQYRKGRYNLQAMWRNRNTLVLAPFNPAVPLTLQDIFVGLNTVFFYLFNTLVLPIITPKK